MKLPGINYIILSAFLVSYAHFSISIRNRLRLSESPLSFAVGIIFGTKNVGVVSPTEQSLHSMQEFNILVVDLAYSLI